MSDLISRQAAIDALKRNTFRLTFAEEQNCEGHVAWSAEAVYSEVMEGALLELPSAQPECKTGRWIDDGDPFMWECDVCGYRVKRYNNTRYCPNCGADMREVDDERLIYTRNNSRDV